MKKKSISRKGKTDFKKSDKMKDSEIDYSDIPELDEDFWKHAVLYVPPSKRMISIRLDSDILNWFKSQGNGYQTKINEILRTYMRAKAA